MSDFLLELRCQEIPARMQAGARAELERLFRAALAEAGVAPGAISVWSTPRRLALIARDLPAATVPVREELKGPRVTAPAAALDGFLRKTGVGREALVEREGVLFAVLERPGRATRDVLAEAIPAIVRGFPWPKAMRWGAASLSSESPRWVRPLSGIVALFDGAVVECAVAGISAGRETRGHRFHAPGPIAIDDVDEYVPRLRAAHVIVDQAEREALVREGARAAARATGLTLVEDEGLVVENAGLTEWPVPLLGRFDAAFLEVPPEVIQLTARTNQKYFIARDAAGALANAFVCTANIAAHDGGAAIVAGNRKVLAARLADARFFWEQDRRKTLAEHAAGLGRITFHEKLGTVADKVERVAKLARWLIEQGIITSSANPLGEGDHAKHGGGITSSPSSLGEGDHPQGGGGVESSALNTPPPSSGRSPSPDTSGEDLAALAEQAARLCKADLVTEMVGEFPELQGVMGGYYARAEGLPEAVAAALRDHYKPVGQGDQVPTAPVTVAVALADKLDTLVQFFAEDLKPTGSKDPFALRRAALAILQLLAHNGLRARLFGIVNRAMALRTGVPDQRFATNSVADEVMAFLIDRLKVQQREAGVRHDLIDAVFALGGEDDLVRLLARVRALQAFVATADGENLHAAYKRAANILKKEGFTRETGAVNRGAAAEPAEAALSAALDQAEPRAAAAVADERFAEAMAALASLRAPIDAFFDEVTVNDPDPVKRAARLALLDRFRAAVHNVADFSRIEG